MIELTPLDVRKKRGDFAKALRGYETQEVDVFLELVAERMEELVKENLQLKERSERLGEQVKGQEGREHAVQEALVTAQELRQDVKEQAIREAALLEREARGRVEQMLHEADGLLAERRTALEELERHRTRFLKAFRTLLERELDSVEVESKRTPLEDVTLDLELGGGSWSTEEDERGEGAAEVDSDAAGVDYAAAEADDDTPEADDDTPEADVDTLRVDGHTPDVDNGREAQTEDGQEETPATHRASEERPEGRGTTSVVDGDLGGATDPTDGSTSGDPDDSLWLSTIMKRDQQESD